MGAGALINLFLCLDAVFSSTEQCSIKKYQILVISKFEYDLGSRNFSFIVLDTAELALIQKKLHPDGNAGNFGNASIAAKRKESSLQIC
jgi:hypothetical protein